MYNSRVYAPHYAIRGHQLERKTDRTLLSLLLYTLICGRGSCRRRRVRRRHNAL